MRVRAQEIRMSSLGLLGAIAGPDPCGRPYALAYPSWAAKLLADAIIEKQRALDPAALETG